MLIPPSSIRLPRLPLAALLLLALAGCRLTGAASDPSGAEETREAPGAGEAGRAAGDAAPCALDWESALARGRARRAAGDLDEARARLRCAHLLHPSAGSIRAELEDVESRLYRKLLAEADELLKKGLSRKAVRVLTRAAAISPDDTGSREAERRLERMGYRLYESRYVHRDNLKSLERSEARMAARRREELELGEEFTLDRRENIRIFTDLPRAEALLHARRLHVLVQALVRAHAELFHPLGLPPRGEPPGGLDFVLFRRRADYEARTGSSSTGGMFLPQQGAAFFYLGERTFEQNVPVLLHEASHLLQNRLLGMEQPPPWIQEGLAVYFEGATVSPLGRLRLPQGLPRLRAVRLQEAAAQGGGRWWGVRRLVERARLTDLHGTDAIHDFYDQAGLLVALLMEDRLLPREMLYRLLAKARDPEARPETSWTDFERILEAYGETEESIDRVLREAVAAGPTTSLRPPRRTRGAPGREFDSLRNVVARFPSCGPGQLWTDGPLTCDKVPDCP